MKRIVTIQDISCVGKCSLTVALPIISAMGVETAILPHRRSFHPHHVSLSHLRGSDRRDRAHFPALGLPGSGL